IIRFLIKNSFEYIDVGCSVDIKINRERLGEPGVVKYLLTCSNNGRLIYGNNEGEGSWFENIQDEDIALGLSVVRKMLRSMDGELTFYTKPGIGNMAEISFYLKLADGCVKKAFYTVGESFNQHSKDLEGFMSGKRILMVEDNEINADITRNVLEYMGAVVEWAINGADAIKLVDKAEENYYDMILMDLQMPEFDGYASTTAIRKLNKKYTEKLPIVALTANVMVSNIKQAMDVGMDDYIIKPIEINSIEKMAKKFFG
ncbi:MAG: response regulator, partial [Wujia sp.]